MTEKFTGLHWHPVLGTSRHILDAPFSWESPWGEVIVPAGFDTDVDSVMRVPLAYMLFKGRTVYAAVIHDWLYRQQELFGVNITRRFADLAFLHAMFDEGVRRAWRYPIWWGVRAGGLRAWLKHKRRNDQ